MTLASAAPVERPAADALRIGTMLGTLARVSDTPGSGVTRLGYTEQEREAHEIFRGWADDLGLTVWEDAAGNTIAERSAIAGMPAIAIGSHLDAVPCGGRFDGVAGVVAALEVVRLIVENRIPHRHPLRVVAFACEEGARFGEACIGSQAVAGLWTGRDLDLVRDARGVSLAEAMRSVGLDPGRLDSAAWHPREWAAFVELHVEQGQVLEQENVEIGLVDVVSGSIRFELALVGRSTHSGSTPMALRADALTAAAEIVLAVETVATDSAYSDLRCTVGRLEVEPGSVTTIPGRVVLTVDVRASDPARQRSAAIDVLAQARKICRRRGIRVRVRELANASPMPLPASLRQVLADQCGKSGVRHRVLSSGASHDARVVNRVVPAALMFVPSAGGLSHVPHEWTSPHALARGTDVLLGGVLALDAVLLG
jgi:allantoate deiminase